MPALQPSRRSLLSAAAALTTGLAGCGGEQHVADDRRDEPPDHDPHDGPPAGATTEFEALSVRAAVEEPFVALDDDENRAGGHTGYLFVLDDDEVDELRFDAEPEPVDGKSDDETAGGEGDDETADGDGDDETADTKVDGDEGGGVEGAPPLTDDVEAVRSFAAETDFDTETVIVNHRGVEDCYRHVVEYIEPADGEFRVQYCRRLRDATVACEADRRVIEAIFLRVPHAYDERPSRLGSGSSSRCRSDHWKDDA